MNNAPLLSICLITYNQEQYIRQTIQSALDQKMNFDYEIVIGEDNSKDGTLKICEEYVRMYPDKITLISRPHNIGMVANWVETIKSCRGKYIAICEGDDYWTNPLKLQKQVDFLEANGEFCICFHDVKILQSGKLLDNYITKVPKAVTSIEDLSKGNYIHTASSVFRNCLETLPKWLGPLNAIDYPLHLLLSEKGNIYFIDECMSVYRVHDKGIYTNADPVKLMKGNVVLLTALIDHLQSKTVKNNLKTQLKNLNNHLYLSLLDRGDNWPAASLAIKNPLNIGINSFIIFSKKLKRKLVQPLNLQNGNKTDSGVLMNFNRSYSQCGEDLIVQYIFKLRGIAKPSYIDIGANDPFYLSNTCLFYEQGCRGINIEANPHLYVNFKMHRPDDINLNVGIGDRENVLDFYIMKDATLSTFSKSESANMISQGKELSEIIKISLSTITAVLNEYNSGLFPDFMSLDVEGMDFQILQSIDFENTCPKVICVEAAEYSSVGAGARKDEIIDFLTSKGYYEYANTNLNAIMVKKEFWFI